MDTRDLYKIVVGLEQKSNKTLVESGPAKRCKCDECICGKSDVSESLEPQDHEASIQEFVNQVQQSDDPFELVYNALSGKSGAVIEGYLQPKYEEIGREHGWHPDDDFEEIISTLVDELCDDSPINEGDDVSEEDDEADAELSEMRMLALGAKDPQILETAQLPYKY